MQASPLLAVLIKEKDNEHLNELTEYFDSSANAHWAVLFPKARSISRSHQWQSLLHLRRSHESSDPLPPGPIYQLLTLPQAVQKTYTATAAKAATNTTPKPSKPTKPML